MLPNPFESKLSVIAGTRHLANSLGLIGAVLQDPFNSNRTWAVTGMYAPINSRRLGGIRAKVVDRKGFVSFINQRDLELVLGLARPGDWCKWADEEYPSLNDPDFYGFVADWEDLADDLFEREIMLRTANPGVLPYGLELNRLVHVNGSTDVTEQNMLLYDCDPETGLGPDVRVETVNVRWTRVGREKITWRKM